jgi:hypothetical protein
MVLICSMPYFAAVTLFEQRRMMRSVWLARAITQCVTLSLGLMGTWGSCLVLQTALSLRDPVTGEGVPISLNVSKPLLSSWAPTHGVARGVANSIRLPGHRAESASLVSRA